MLPLLYKNNYVNSHNVCSSYSILHFFLFLSLLLSVASDSVAEKFLSYNRANRAVAILCNHQRAVPKAFDQQMTNLQGKV